MPEADLPARLARRLAAAAPRAGSCRILAIDGPSGAGKSTLAAAVAAELGPAQIIAVDDLIPGWTGLSAGPGLLRRDVITPLTDGRDGAYRRYDWVEGAYADWILVPRADHLVIEGCGAGARELAAYVSMLVWVDAPVDLRFERGMARDGEAFRPFWSSWERESQAMFAAEQTERRADVRVAGQPD